MPAILVLAVVAGLAAMAAIVFVAVVVAIHAEPRNQMATKPHGPLRAMVRRLLGVYVSESADAATDGNRQECLTGQSTDWWPRGGWDQGRPTRPSG